MPEASAQSESRIDYREIPKQSGKAEKNRIAPHFSAVTLAREPLINEVGEWNRESCHLGFSD
ncbi:hypothetical protein [Ralstonia solanacearum]|uniref:hypothetical protein n=1 Tax=Ralstonia solanacearum TaxID=305 RepID=UPI0018D1A090|nr:hypothetical protein [Ralstonia solanacearum]